MSKYYVIGGQYKQVFYGESKTLLGAKRIATKNAEYWDNWQGWHIPKIYDSHDCRSYHEIDGLKIYHMDYAIPVAVHNGKKWVMNMEEK